MSSQPLVDDLRKLIEKNPQVIAAVAEAAKPVERKIANTAYVYNGYEDLSLLYLGAYRYAIPFQRVTRIDAQPEHQEVDQSKSGSGHIVRQTIPLKGESIAREIIENRRYGKQGVVVFVHEGLAADDPVIDGVRVPRALKESADAAGQAYKLMAIEEFLVKRSKAQAGQPGNPMRPSGHIYDWMRKFRGDDEMFAEQHKKTDSTAMMAKALEKLSQLVEGITGTAAASKLPSDLPKIAEGEKREAYKERLAKWVEAQGN